MALYSLVVSLIVTPVAIVTDSNMDVANVPRSTPNTYYVRDRLKDTSLRYSS